MNNSIEYHSSSCISLYYYIFMQVGAGETAIIWWCSCLCMCVSGWVWVSVCGSEESGRLVWQGLGRTEWLVIVSLLTQWLTASGSWVFLYWIIPDAFRNLHPKLVKYCRGNGIPIRHFDCTAAVMRNWLILRCSHVYFWSASSVSFFVDSNEKCETIYVMISVRPLPTWKVAWKIRVCQL